MNTLFTYFNERRPLFRIYLGFALLFVVASFFIPYVNDYPQYIMQWQRMLHGASPYETPSGNFKMFRYGPSHNAFVFPYALHDNLPRVLFFSSWTIAAWILVSNYFKILPNVKAWVIPVVVGFSFLNPYLFQLYYYGQNDLFVGALLFLALSFHHKKAYVIAALCFVLAFTYKLYPIVLMPYFFYDNQLGSKLSRKQFFASINWKFVGWFVVFTVATMGIQYAVYGEYGLRSYFTVLDRKPTSSSVFYFLTEVAHVALNPNVSIVTALFGLFATMFLYVFNKIDRYAGIILAILIVFMSSKVFYFSYELCFLLILPFYKCICLKEGKHFKIIPFFVIIAVVFTAVLLFRYGFDYRLKDYKGALYLIPNGYLFFYVLTFSIRRSHASVTAY